MSTGETAGRGIVTRILWGAVALLLVFAQVASASALCLPGLAGAHHPSVGAVADTYHGLDSHCADVAVPSNQAPAPEAKRLAPDVGVPMRAAWSISPGVRAARVTFALARAGPSLPLQFRNLRL